MVRAKPKLSSSGFSLIEVTAALAMLAIAVMSILGSQQSSLQLLKSASTHDQSVTLAKMKMNEVNLRIQNRGIKEVKELEKGKFEDERFKDFRWSIRRQAVPAPNFESLLGAGGEDDADNTNQSQQAGLLGNISKVWAESIHELRVRVEWGPESRPKSYELISHYIEPTAVAQLQGGLSKMSGGSDDGGDGSQDTSAQGNSSP